MNVKTYCGFITIVGRSNVGKSTLLNSLLGLKVSITSRKIHTTRHCVVGIHTEGPYQAIYVDTPGVSMKGKRVINQSINKEMIDSIHNVDLIIFVVESTRWTLDDEIVLSELCDSKTPVILAINKVDILQEKATLLPLMLTLSKKMNFTHIVPLSAEIKLNVGIIASIVRKCLPESAHHFPVGYVTDRSLSFIASEIIREKLMRFLGAELPYSVTVNIECFLISKYGGYNISGLILVKRKGLKKTVIGNNGSKIKIIGIESRKDMLKIFKVPVSLKLWVKVKPCCPIMDTHYTA